MSLKSLVNCTFLSAFVLFQADVFANVGTGEKKALKKVFAKPVKAIEIFDKFTYPAKVYSRVQSTILADAVGVVDSIRVELGDSVKQKQVLALIRNTDPVYKFSSQKTTTPIAGVVGEIFISRGNHVKRGDRLITVTDPLDLRVRIEVPAKDLKYFKKKQSGKLQLHYLDKDVDLSIVGIGPIVSQVTGTATVELKILNKSDVDKVKIGTLGKAWFKLNGHEGISVPDHAVVYKGREPVIKIVKDKKIKSVKIKLGDKREGFVEIVSGIKSGDLVVTRVSGFVADGEEVEVK